MTEKGQIRRFFNHLIDWLSPRFVYEVSSCSGWFSAFFRTERAAIKYMDEQEKTDPAIYNGAYSLELIKHSFYGKNKARK